jgi:hypothetical protein
VKLLIEDLVEIGPLASFAVIAASFTIGIIASVIADRRDPDSERLREERVETVKQEVGDDGSEPAVPEDLEQQTGAQRG